MTPQQRFAFGPELIVDLFAGGGGASLGIEQAFGRPVDVAVNHDAAAIAMHAANHPGTVHHTADVFEVDPVEATGGRQVGLLWASPDCKHFSKAKGGKPRSKKIRSLAWVVVKWAATVKPRVIMLENVEEFVTWGPLAQNGRPCPRRKGVTFQRWVARLRGLGYKVEWRELRACDYGAPTIRKRFFLIARCDGLPIRWPAPTHGKPGSAEVGKGKRLPWRTAAECIDWTLPCPSIFLTREQGRAIGVKRPLAEATMRRIAKGVQRFVIDNPRPFIVATRNGEREGQKPRTRQVDEPYWTVTAQGSQGALVAPFLTEHANGSGQRVFDAQEPLRTQVSEIKGGHFALVAAHMEQANAGHYAGTGRPVDAPASTITSRGSQQQLVATSLVKLRGTRSAEDPQEPLHTVSAQGFDNAEIRAFLVAYYGNEEDGISVSEPMRTVVSRDRFGLVTVDGTDYAIADIGLRMLTPRELFRAQGFPDSYVIDVTTPDSAGRLRPLPKAAQVRMVGNSVCPQLARALVEANVGELRATEGEAMVA